MRAQVLAEIGAGICTQLDFLMPLPGGGSYRNVVMQAMRMRWGRITWIHTLEDTQRCMRLLQWRAEQGEVEALAAPISDAEWPPAGLFPGREPATLPA